jgi:hypothetical protein
MGVPGSSVDRMYKEGAPSPGGRGSRRALTNGRWLRSGTTRAYSETLAVLECGGKRSATPLWRGVPP